VRLLLLALLVRPALAGDDPDTSLLEAVLRDDATDADIDALVDELVEHADRAGAVLLIGGADLAFNRGRLEDAAFLAWAAQARASIESGPPADRMMTPREHSIATAFDQSLPPIEQAIGEAPSTYTAAAARLEAWRPVFGQAAWYVEGPDRPADPPADFAQAHRDRFVRELKLSAAFVASERWRAAEVATRVCRHTCCPRAPEALAERRQVEVEILRGLVQAGALPWTSWHTPVDEAFTDPATRDLLIAALSGDRKATKKAVAKAGDPNTPGPLGYTPLTWILGMEQPESLRVLLDAGADPNRAGTDGTRPLTVAARLPGSEQLTMLIDAGAKVEGADGTQALGVAIGNGCVQAAATLVQRGASPDTVDLTLLLGSGGIGMVREWITDGTVTDLQRVGTAAERSALDDEHCAERKALLEDLVERGVDLPTDAWRWVRARANLECFPAAYAETPAPAEP
jgi:ankyrin repeat protein